MRDAGPAAGLPGDRAGDRRCASHWPSPRSSSRGCSAASSARRVSGWRWGLVWAAAAGVVVGVPVALLPARIAGSWSSASRRSSARSARCCGQGLRPRGPRAVPAAQGRCAELREAEEAAAARDQVEDRHRLNASVPEVPHSGEHHRQARLVGGGDHFVVADRAARLDHRGRAGLDRGEQAVGEGEEGVRGDRRADRARLGPAVRLGRFLGLGAAMRALSRRFIWPAPMPAVTPSLA